MIECENKEEMCKYKIEIGKVSMGRKWYLQKNTEMI